jgi:glycosyltransferase involved in cell wall biosynthesis
MSLKIFHFISSGGFYGAEVVLLTLMEESVRLGHRCQLGNIADPGMGPLPIEAEAERRGLGCTRFETGTIPGPGGVGRILRAIRDGGYDVVHTHGYKANVIFGLVPRRHRPFPVVSTLHGWCSTRRFSKLRFFEWLDARTLPRRDAVVPVSRQMLELPGLRGRHDLPLLTVIPNAAAPPAAAPPGPEADEITAFCGRAFTFGAIGRLSPEKNFIALLEALHRLLERGGEAQVLIFGEGPQRESLHRFARQHGLGHRLMMPGYVRAASRYLPAMGAFVLSSTREGMPISILEAMTAGTPIVSTAVGEVPEMLDQGAAGLLVPPADAAGLAEAMGRMLDDDGLRGRLSTAASRIVDERWSAAGMTRAYLDLYHRALRAVSTR